MRSVFRDAYRYAYSIVRNLDTSGAETRAPRTDEFGRAAYCPSLPQPWRLSAEEEKRRRRMYDALRSASADVWCLNPQTTEIVKGSDVLCRLADEICHGEVETVKVKVFNVLDEIEKLGYNVSEVSAALRAALV
jgi:hypothetical protein